MFRLPAVNLWHRCCRSTGDDAHARVFPSAMTGAKVGPLLRTLGFAAAPGLLNLFGLPPGVAVLAPGEAKGPKVALRSA